MPADFDYEMWLGPAPEAPFCPARLHSNWRWFYDYSGGNITDFGAHHLDIVQWALDTEHSGPVLFDNFKATWPPKGELYNTITVGSPNARINSDTGLLALTGGISTGGNAFVVGGAGNTTATAQFDNISFLSPQQAWRQTNFGTTNNTGNAADPADPDFDGYENLLEYALASTPTTAASVPAISTGLVLTEPDPEEHLEITFSRIADPLLLYAVEATDDLTQPWTTIWTSTGAANTAGPVTVSDSVNPASPRLRRFIRLRVTAP